MTRRATQQVRVTGSTAEGNAGNGYTLSGEPLADGPSASGASVASYGGNSVSSSTARGNGHYGVEVIGGIDVGVQNNTIDGGDMGIVARDGTRNISITGTSSTTRTGRGSRYATVSPPRSSPATWSPVRSAARTRTRGST